MLWLAGALFAQVHGFADVTMGVGTIIYRLGRSHYWRGFAAHPNNLIGTFSLCVRCYSLSIGHCICPNVGKFA